MSEANERRAVRSPGTRRGRTAAIKHEQVKEKCQGAREDPTACKKGEYVTQRGGTVALQQVADMLVQGEGYFFLFYSTR